MDMLTRVQTLDEAVYISHNANIPRKSMNRIIPPPPAISKYLAKLDSLSWVWPPVLENEIFEFKPVNLCLKLTLYHIQVE